MQLCLLFTLSVCSFTWSGQWLYFPVAEGRGATCFIAYSVTSTEYLCHTWALELYSLADTGKSFSPRHLASEGSIPGLCEPLLMF